MFKSLLVFCLLLVETLAYSQNIYTVLHLNDISQYKTKKPKRILETKTFYSSRGKSTEKLVEAFDPSGMLITEERFNEEENLTARLTYANDTLRKLILNRTFERWMPIGYRKEIAYYTYNKFKFLIEITDKDANGNTFQLSRIENNEQGHPILLSLFDGTGNLLGREGAVYFYDKNQCVTSVWSADGRALSKDTIKITFNTNAAIDNNELYNDHGDMIAWDSKNLNGNVTHYEAEFTYDAYGNWTENKIFKVSIKTSGKKKRDLDRVFRKQYAYE